MLVISRKEFERVRIGKDIIVTIVRVDATRVKIGIEAPESIKILRDELEDREAA